MKLNDLTGMVYGRLTVVRRASQDQSRHGARWECLCSCGKTKVTFGHNLVRGGVKSCGCIHKEQLVERNRAAHLVAEPWLVDMRLYIRKLGFRKKRAGLGSNQHQSLPSANEHPATAFAWNLSLEAYKKLVTSACFYCGSLPNQRPKGVLMRELDLRRNGIDRKDNARGYDEDNCVSCCASCNREKRAQSFEVFIENTRRRYEHLKAKGLITT